MVFAVLKAVLIVLVAAGLRISLNPLLGADSPFMFFFPAILVATWLWGRGPGLVSVGVSAICVAYFWLSARGPLGLNSTAEMIHLGLFCAVAAGLSTFVYRLSIVTAQLSISEQRYKSLVRSTGGFVWITDAAGVSKMKPDQWEEVTGRKSYKQGDWAAMIDPEDLKAVKARFIAAAAQKQSYRAEFKMLSKEGPYHWFTTRAVPILDKKGEVLEWVGVTYDIHAAKMAEAAVKENERRLRLAIELAGLTVYDWEPITGALQWDRRLKAIWGLPENAPIDMTVFRAGVHPEDLPLVEQRMRHATDPNLDGIYDAEFRVIGIEDKVQRWVAARGQTTFVAGKPASYVGAVLDITERKRAEEKLETAVAERTAELRATIADLEAFSYSISHDLRGPLRVMQSFAQALAEDCGESLSSIGKDYIRRIVSAAERMDRIIQEVLVYSRIARTELPLERIALKEFISSLLDGYPAFHDAEADISLPEELPTVWGNQAALTQCLSNLLENALKFVAPGVKPQVKIAARVAEGRAFLSIRDNGIGIPKRAHEAIFGLFYRLDQSYEGTGIGLAIVRKAIERMGGRITLESEPERGSTFTLELPVANPP